MNKPLAIFAALVLALLAGIGLGRFLDSAGPAPTPGATAEAGREILYWVAPMDPDFRRDGPGKSPMGMDLVPVYADDVESTAGIVKIDPVVVSNLGVRTAPAERSSLSRIIDTPAYVSYDEDTIHHFHTRVDGWIENLAATATGDVITAGDLLFELYSPTLVNAQQEYLAAIRSGSATLKRASRDRLQSLGLTDSDLQRLDTEGRIRQRLSVYAERDGVITELGVREGKFVTPNTDVISIAALDTVWVFGDVLERQSRWVEPGQAATLTFEALPGERYSAVVDYVYPELDPLTRTLRVRLRLDNVDALLRPNMFGRLQIDGRETGPIVNVPREAAIRNGKETRVVVDLGDGRFESRVVRLGIESGDRIAVRSGLDAGESVVVSGQFLIDSESNVRSALARMQSRDKTP